MSFIMHFYIMATAYTIHGWIGVIHYAFYIMATAYTIHGWIGVIHYAFYIMATADTVLEPFRGRNLTLLKQL